MGGDQSDVTTSAVQHFHPCHTSGLPLYIFAFFTEMPFLSDVCNPDSPKCVVILLSFLFLFYSLASSSATNRFSCSNFLFLMTQPISLTVTVINTRL